MIDFIGEICSCKTPLTIDRWMPVALSTRLGYFFAEAIVSCP
jgi:hypothetical protein